MAIGSMDHRTNLGGQLRVATRILAIADIFEALTARKRPTRPAEHCRNRNNGIDALEGITLMLTFPNAFGLRRLSPLRNAFS